MQSVAFARPVRPAMPHGAAPAWSTRLRRLRSPRLAHPRVAAPPWPVRLRRVRELGRLALTALVLAVGLGAATAVPAAATPAGAARPVVVASRPDELRPGRAPAAALPADAALPQARPALPARPASVAAPVTGAVDRPAADFTRDAVARRGPPRR
ncbi:hypothetical protein ACFY2R_03370 [Micromonospora olivasterospora]|uniref:Uncharacterized protein n=1 Tax=Micromonospora olivasterospora TaxID=1880 RepID=A0A562IB28_MICOL|nr:hypothetical protein [Micromonospora olivasterospora]TWH68066.1 hypothetical protein JD77_03053 [Micromonospora olivasterospora]